MRLYIQTVITQQYAQMSELLAALVACWRVEMVSGGTSLDRYSRHLATTVSSMVESANSSTLKEDDVRACMVVSSRWITTLCKIAEDSKARVEDGCTSAVGESVTTLLLTLMNTTAGHNLLAVGHAPKILNIQHALNETIESSVGTMPNISMRLMDVVQRYPHLLGAQRTGKSHDQDPTLLAIHFQENITATPMVPVRITTAVLLYYLLITLLTIDDAALCALMSHRYNNDNVMIYSELLHASFDVLVKANESSEDWYKTQCATFLFNKLPSVLAYILQLATFESLPTEQLLINLWNGLDASGDQHLVSTARRFLRICSFHHLISPSTVENVTGESAEVSSAKGLLSRESLVEQVAINAARGPRLIDELHKNDGNAGIVSSAILNIMHRYCTSGETGHLKDMAVAFLRKPDALNVLIMFSEPSYVLSPVCRMLDDWSWEDNQGESQPVYEEFGNILLFVLILKRRLRLRINQLGLSSNNGFVARYLSSEGTVRGSPQLSVDEQKRLGDWIEALFFADGGLTDELFGSCDPKDFYLMVPSLLYQAMHAYRLAKLPEESLRNNLEYLLEPSLLPSLLTAFSWLGRIAEEYPKEATLIAQILTKSPGIPETRDIHRTILATSRSDIRRQLSRNANVDQLAEFQSCFSTQVESILPHEYGLEELHLWQSTDGGILQYLEKAVSEMLLESDGALPPRGLVQAAIRICGPTDVLHSFVTLLIQYSATEHFAQALDLLSMVIAASTTEEVSLSTVLHIQYARLGQYLKKGHNLYAEALVHLSRRVQLYTTLLLPQHMDMEGPGLPLVSGEIADIGLDTLPVSTTTNLDADMTQQQAMADLSHGTNVESDTDMVDQTINDILNDTNNLNAATDDDQLNQNMDELNDFDFDLDNTDNYELGELNDFDLNMF